jgi:allantoinase
MSDSFVIKSRQVLLPTGISPASIVVEKGRIARIDPFDSHPAAEDVSPHVIMPGCIDPHVHCNDPGRTDWESFPTATRAAAAGGITTLIDMPLNSSPVSTSLDNFQVKLRAARDTLFVDVGFHGGLIANNAIELPALIDAGVLGIKAFLCHSGIDEFPNAGPDDLAAAMPLCAAADIPLLVHCELVADLPSDLAATAAGDPRKYATYLATRPPSWETAAIKMLIDHCRIYHCPTHIVHLATEEGLPLIAAAKRDKLPLTAETCPHYLYFKAEEIPDGATQYKCAPPIRASKTREALWRGLASHELDLVASDHSPCPPDMKRPHDGNFLKAWGGISSLQLALPIVWTGASERGHSLTDIAEWMAAAPARLMRLTKTKGSIETGKDADLIVFDPDSTFTVDPTKLLHRHALTPYAGRTLRGIVHRTILRGHTIARDGAVTDTPTGRTILRGK